MRLPGSCLLAGVVLVAGAVLTRLPGGAGAGGEAPAAQGRPVGWELRGAGSCAAAACHNGNGPKGSKGSEYTTWVLHDPHSHAFEVLYGKQSLQIEKNRQPLPGVEKDHPERDPLCLNCHVQPGIAAIAKGGEKLPRRRAFSLEDGVSCEACHGAAGPWLTQHYTDAWHAKTAAQKAAAGMTDTKDLRVRAEVCVRCHVGEGNLDVNHDLIAAGHPRLNFEYSAFLANMPKHWSEKAEKDRAGAPDDFEAHVWAVGQAVAARASLDLLAHRADPEQNKKRWPEFAEYDCFACHHDLAPKSWRSGEDNAKRRNWTPAWNTWYVSPTLESLGKARPQGKPDRLEGQLAEVRKSMSFFSPNRAATARAAGEAAKSFRQWVGTLETTRYDGPKLKPLVGELAAGLDGGLSGYNWDQAVQSYLALAAMHQTLTAQGLPDVPATRREYLTKLKCQLEFPYGYDSPRGLDPAALPKK